MDTNEEIWDEEIGNEEVSPSERAYQEFLEVAADGLSEINSVQPIAVADLDTSAPINYYDETEKRMDGPTREIFLQDVQSYSNLLQTLPPFSTRKIYEELQDMNTDFPKETYDIAEIHVMYSTLHRYRERIMYLRSLVTPYHDLLTQATEDLRKVAVKLWSGTGPDKTAYATFVTKGFSQRLTIVHSLIDAINQRVKVCESGQAQCSSILRHHEYLAKMNMGYQQIGASIRHEQHTRPEVSRYRSPSED